jgi:hypothetical protein
MIITKAETVCMVSALMDPYQLLITATMVTLQGSFVRGGVTVNMFWPLSTFFGTLH